MNVLKLEPIQALKRFMPWRGVSVRGSGNALIVMLFAVAVVVPVYGFFTQPTVTVLQGENRPPAVAPQLEFKKYAIKVFPLMWEFYFNDRIGYRQARLEVRQRVFCDVFQESPNPLVLLGQNDWLYVNNLAASGPIAVPGRAMVPEWATTLAARHEYLKARGIQYFVYVAREKSYLYPENLPPAARRHHPADVVPDLQAALRAAGSDLVLIDPLPAMIAHKTAGGELLYYRHDSHWNDAGLGMGYQAIAGELRRRFPECRTKTADDFTLSEHRRPILDLEPLVGLPADRQGETYVARFLRAPTDYPAHSPELDALVRDPLPHILHRHAWWPGTPGPRTMLLHDSFGVNIANLLAGDVPHLTSIGTYGLPLKAIDAEQPQIVIQLMVDRVFRGTKPDGMDQIFR